MRGCRRAESADRYSKALWAEALTNLSNVI